MTRGSTRGFTLIELLIASAIVLTITGAVFQLLNPARAVFQAQPEVADLQQRLRVAVDSLARDLLVAGAGADIGAAGPLVGYFAPVLPYRLNSSSDARASDPFFRDEAITLVTVPLTSAQTTIVNASQGTLTVEPQGNCPPRSANRLCGFAAGARVVAIDPHGAWDRLTLTSVQPDSLRMTYDGTLSTAYASGSTLAEAVTRTYFLKADAATDTYQLMQRDADSTDLPVVDDVVGLKFEYFGDPQPPRVRAEAVADDPAGRGTTYGPRPPAVKGPAQTGWPAGENCVFRVVDAQHVPRLPVLGNGANRAALAETIFADGPWCPHATAVNRFDADLLRIRSVRVTVRVQVGAAALRGRGELFAHPGTAIGGNRYVPDREIRFDVSPRNLNLGG